MIRLRIVAAAVLLGCVGFGLKLIRETPSTSPPAIVLLPAKEDRLANLEESVMPALPQQRVGWVVGQVLGVETPSLAPSQKQMFERAVVK